MPEKINISVVIPVFNDEKNIASCLDSVLLKQFMPGVEVICVNDGSTDNSLQILQEYHRKFSNVIVISQENHGLCVARNRGMEIARGTYVYFVDSDDILADNMLIKAWKLCHDKDLDVLFFSFESFGDTPSMNEKYYNIICDIKRKHSYSNKVMSGREMFCQFCQVDEYHVMVWLQMIKREFLIQNGIRFYDGILFEDNLYTFLVLMNAQRTYCTKDIWYYKRIRENSIVTMPERPENVLGFLTTAIAVMDYIKTNMPDKDQNLKICQEAVLKNLFLQIHKRYHRLTAEKQQQLLDNCSTHEYLALKSILMLADGQLYQ